LKVPVTLEITYGSRSERLEPIMAQRRFLCAQNSTEERKLTLGTILLIILVLVVIGALPRWGYSRNWGYGPSGGLGLILVILLILVLFDKI
jgi:sterol desaturase/sphingolipid hydroxylase (fatty acid hydroxylase superfamily)